MNWALAERRADQAEPTTDVEDIGPSRRVESDRSFLHVSDGTIAAEANSFIKDISISSTTEVVRLIGVLQGLRDFLQSESQRVQREVERYVQLSEGMLQTAKTIVKNIPKWDK